MLNDKQIIERFSQNSVAQEMGFNKDDSVFIKACLKEWHRPHRYYHGFNHLSRLMKEIGGLSDMVWNPRKKFWMEALALTHDVICYPAVNDNEERSIDFIEKNMWHLNLDYGMKNPMIISLVEGINCTKYKKSNDFRQLDAKDCLRMFCQLDIGRSCMCDEAADISSVAHREIQLMKEFQLWDFCNYRQKRLGFIDRFKYFAYPFKKQATEFLSSYRPRIGVYAGSFFPFHLGHMDIVEQAEKVFDKVIIAVGKNPSKENITYYKGHRRVESILPFHQVVYYDGLLSDYLKTFENYADVALIRGLRSGYDLDYEMQQLRVLQDYECKAPVTYFLCSKDTTHISSSMIRGLAKFENSDIEKYLPTKYQYAIS